ncbi:MAG: serine/threonine-protein kinase, partial [Anaerolineae bacterium]
MAWVYLAEDLIQGGKVAVKILYPQHSKDLRFVQRFNREARLSMSLSQCASHTNVVCVLDYGADRDTHYLVMEYVPGQDLGQFLEQQGPLPWQEALAIARQVALALSHAHELDVVHRDIKPSNIMVLSDGTTRVLDFGIARVRTSPQLTLEGFVGSPHYAAPEQAQGEEVDIRADIYSLGIVTYRMLSGDLPFQGDTPWAVVNQHLIAEPLPLA